jgi:hypothetical protein
MPRTSVRRYRRPFNPSAGWEAIHRKILAAKAHLCNLTPPPAQRGTDLGRGGEGFWGVPLVGRSGLWHNIERHAAIPLERDLTTTRSASMGSGIMRVVGEMNFATVAARRTAVDV